MYVRIKKLREKNKLSKKQLADFLNISHVIYEAYESGKKKVPLNILIKLSEFYNTSIDYIVENTDDFISHKKINS